MEDKKCKFDEAGKCTNSCADANRCPAAYTEQKYEDCDWYCAPLQEEEVEELKNDIQRLSTFTVEELSTVSDKITEYIEQLEAKNSELLATCDALREEKGAKEKEYCEFSFKSGQILAHAQEQTKRKYIQQTLQDVYDEVSQYKSTSEAVDVVLELAEKAGVKIEL